MPRIINAYADGTSSIADSLAKLGESIYGDQAKNEVFRQKAFSGKRENDNAQPLADALRSGNAKDVLYYGSLSNRSGQDIGDNNRAAAAVHSNGNVDDPRLATAFMGAGGAFSNTAPGQGRSLANDRSIAGGHDATTLESQRIQSDRAAATQLAIDGRTLTKVDDGKGGFRYELKSNAVGQGAPISTDEMKAGVISTALRNRANRMTGQPGAFPANGTTPWDTAAKPAAPQGDIFAGLTPQERQLVGVNTEQPMVNPRTGKTGISRDSGTTLENGQPATGFMPTTNEGALAAEKHNNTRTAAAVPLPPAPTEFPQYAQDAYTAGGPGAAIQHDVNAMKGLVGLGEFQPDVNRARENLTNTNNSVRSLYASAPGARAAVYREKNAERALPEANNFFGTTGINAEQQRNKAMSEITHLREQYALVQADATNPNTPPEEAAKMLAWLHSAKDAILTMSKPRAQAEPTAGTPPAADAKPETVMQNGFPYHIQPDGTYR